MYWLETIVPQLPLQALNLRVLAFIVRAQAGDLALEVLGVATGAGEACNAVCCTTFGVVLGAGRAASGLRVAAYLADL